jgi:butyryl-CoA dehydrogenase
LKLSAACVGAARYSLDGAIAYACERTAFGKPIAGFGLIQEKLAECAAGIYVGEAMVYRTIGMIDRALADVDAEAAGAAREIQKRIEEYAVECSIVKVWGSEMLDRVVDHAVQIHGGYGFVEEYPAERAYRDSRVNRIFEGTNEINRLIITGWTMKRAASGQLPLRKAVEEFMGGVLAGGGAPTGPSTAARQMALFAAGVAWQKFGPKLSDEQEVMGALADCLMELYAIESCTLRAAKAGATRQAVCLAQYYAAGGLAAIESAARKVLAAAAAGDELRTQTAILRRLARRDAIDVVALGREIAGHLVRAGRYSL